MADIGEKPALDLVQFLQLLIVFLKLTTVLVELKSEAEFSEAKPVVKMTSNGHKDAGHQQEIDVIDENSIMLVARKAVSETRRGVQRHHLKKNDQAVLEGPSQDERCSEQDQIQACVIGG